MEIFPASLINLPVLILPDRNDNSDNIRLDFRALQVKGLL